VISSVIGIYLFLISGNHFSIHRLDLNLALNAPIYDTKALANNTSPIIVNVFFYNTLTVSPHLLFSPDNPCTNVSAADNFAKHILASASTFYFLASASSKFFLKAATFSFNTLTFSLITAN
jgi:hypothetical protein